MTLSTPKNQRGFLSIDAVMWIMLVTVALGFIAFIGYVRREPVVAGADAVVESFDQLVELVLA